MEAIFGHLMVKYTKPEDAQPPYNVIGNLLKKLLSAYPTLQRAAIDEILVYTDLGDFIKNPKNKEELYQHSMAKAKLLANAIMCNVYYHQFKRIFEEEISNMPEIPFEPEIVQNVNDLMNVKLGF